MAETARKKIIKVGSSAGVVIPVDDLKRLGVTYGDELDVTFETVNEQPDSHSVEVVELTQKLIKRHKTALKNLSER